MRSSLLITLLFLALHVKGQSFSDVRKMFWTQIQQTCQGNFAFSKTVKDLSGEQPDQTLSYSIDCGKGMVTIAGKPTELPLGDFSYLFEYDFDNAYLSPLMDIQRSATLVSATTKSGQESETPLQMAHFKLQNGMIQFAKVIISKSNPLYDLFIQIEVQFNPDGHYASHKIVTKSDVLLGSEVKTQITGEVRK